MYLVTAYIMIQLLHMWSRKGKSYFCDTVHSPTDAHLLEFFFKFTLKLDGSYTFRSTTFIRELAIEPG